MNREEFRALDVAGRLPTPNGVALKLWQLLKSDIASAQEIARAINCDAGLTGRVIGAANAFAVRGARPVASAVEALARVGTAATCRLALGFSVLSANRTGDCADFDYRRFWGRSVVMGITLQILATRVRIVAPEEAFTVGLMTEIGDLALAALHPDEYGPRLGHIPLADRAARVVAERAAFGTDHVELSEYLLSGWGFPAILIEPVSAYGKGGREVQHQGSRGQLFADALRLGDLVARSTIGPGTDTQATREMAAVAVRLKLSPDELESVGKEIALAWPRWAELLELDAQDLGPIVLVPQDEPATTGSANDSAGGTPAASVPLHALAVSTDPVFCRTLAALASEASVTMTFAADARTALAAAQREAPPFMLVHWQDGTPAELEICRVLRKSACGPDAYIVVLGVHALPDALAMAQASGADDLLPWPASAEVFSARAYAVRRLVALQQALATEQDELRRRAAVHGRTQREMRELARTDPVTGLPNKRHAMEMLQVEWDVARRSGDPVACVLIDTGAYKASSAYAVADARNPVLQQLAAAMRDAARASDTVCHLGGDRFLVICRRSDHQAGVQCAERLQLAVARAGIVLPGNAKPLSICTGVADIAQEGVRDLHTLQKALDHALHANRGGVADRVQGAA